MLFDQKKNMDKILIKIMGYKDLQISKVRKIAITLKQRHIIIIQDENKIMSSVGTVYTKIWRKKTKPRQAKITKKTLKPKKKSRVKLF